MAEPISQDSVQDDVYRLSQLLKAVDQIIWEQPFDSIDSPTARMLASMVRIAQDLANTAQRHLLEDFDALAKAAEAEGVA
ncbi:Ribosomal subunit interface protein [Hyphomicrobiales bacterium]|nr:Ribosomal subunit interface protein [Hyphomicrobiales bacterium]CAH1697275.1 Ribosomal subunit interface protein [Hyphomicrobiales bacterium]CAI0342842.1 hypothetical protein BO1005MUT1_10135 [Hyphomicrobiales bacterium]